MKHPLILSVAESYSRFERRKDQSRQQRVGGKSDEGDNMSTAQSSFQGYRTQVNAPWPESMPKRTTLRTARAARMTGLAFDPAAAGGRWTKA
jgi:hypothetical protein